MPDALLLATDLPVWPLRIFALLFGALWGSFFNVAIHRWPRGMSVVKPPSHCPACGAAVRWYWNVPVLGYFLLRGRAACCGARLSPRYVWVEVLSGVLGLAIVERFVLGSTRTAGAAGIEAALYFTFAGGLLIATFVDLEWMEIPDEVSLPGAALGLATVGYRMAPGALDAAVGAGVGFLVVQVLFVWVYELCSGRRGMGEGDAKLLLMIGAFLGWESVLFCLVAGSVQGLLVAGVAMLTGVPLVPALDESPPDAPAAAPAAAHTHEPATAAAALSDTPAPGTLPVASRPSDAALAGARASALPPASPAMMVFGPMLAVSALEYLFWGQGILGWLGDRVQP